MANYSEKSEKIPRVYVGINDTFIKKGESFVLSGGYYKNEDESIIIRSTHATGKLFKPATDPDSQISSK